MKPNEHETESDVQVQPSRESTVISRKSHNMQNQPEWSLEGQHTTMRNAFRERAQYNEEERRVIESRVARAILLAGGEPKPFSPTPRTDVWEKTINTPTTTTATRIRVPTPKERRIASKNRQSHVFAVKLKDGVQGSIWCSHDEALGAAGRPGRIQRFDKYTTMSRNINAAKSWIKQTDESAHSIVNPKVVRGNTITQQTGSEYCKQEEVDEQHTSAPTLGIQTLSESIGQQHVSLKVLMQHKQVSHVQSVSKKVKRKMDTFCTCTPGRLILNLNGRTACRVQRDLRCELVADLQTGNDTAAFVCSQLGINTAPRADQLELLMAAMPGAASIVFEGPPAESGLDIDYWKKCHLTHCKNGCTEKQIHPDCYFKIMHHFLLRGYDPDLQKGYTWDDLKTQTEAYIPAWNKEKERSEKAWKKWETEAADLLSPPSTKEPKLIIPLLPAARSKHVWRYHKYGTPYKIRLCLDLKSAQVNDAVSDWKFRYRGLDDLASSINKGDWLASVDISRFYLRLPAGKNLRSAQWVQDPTTYEATAAKNKASKLKRWRQLLAIGFGLKTAPAWASAVSAELTRTLEAAGIRVAGCFLDDILIAGKSKEECEASLKKAMSIMKRLGIPANDKTVPPQSPEVGITFLGIHIRTSDMRFSVSNDHKEYAIDRVQEVLDNKTASKRELSSIAGVLTWISFVFLPGKPRRQHIYDAASGGSKSTVVQITGSLQRQLRWWLNTLRSDRFTGVRLWDNQESPCTMLVRSDSSGEDGWGACLGNFHIVGPWPEDLMDTHMLFKELVPIVISLSLLADKIPETVFGAAVDNTGAAFAVNRLACRDKISLRLLQQLAQVLHQKGHTALASHVYRYRNEHADDLSHNLFPACWEKIVEHQTHVKSDRNSKFWFFPFVVQCLITKECKSGQFRMSRELFSSGGRNSEVEHA